MKTLKVLPNPYSFVHPELGPQGACPVDNAGRANAPRRYVGAKLASRVLEKRDRPSLAEAEFSKDKTERIYRPDREQTWFVFDMENPVEVPDTPYYRDRLREGGLVPADAETAKRGRAMFENLEAAKQAAAAQLKAERGADAQMGELRRAKAQQPAPQKQQQSSSAGGQQGAPDKPGKKG